MRSLATLVVTLFLLLPFAACNQGPKQPVVGFVTNSVADFWTIAIAGANNAAKEFGVDVKIMSPPTGQVTEQHDMLNDLITREVAGIAVTPLNPKDQTSHLNEIAKKTILITHDSDAPESDRLCFIGVDNYEAGRQCGKLVLEAIPNGGKIMMFVADLDKDNARRRRQGVIDEVFGRTDDPSRRDPVGAALKSKDGKYEFLGCLTDGFDRQKAKDNAEDSLTKHEDIACMVGLYEYNPPQILEAIQSAKKLGKVKIVGFDENRATLQGIRDGHIHGTIAQDPYNYGFKSVKMLSELIKGDKSGIPANKIVDVPAQAVTKANVDAFEANLDKLLGKKK